MVYTSYLWRSWGWFMIVLSTLSVYFGIRIGLLGPVQPATSLCYSPNPLITLQDGFVTKTFRCVFAWWWKPGQVGNLNSPDCHLQSGWLVRGTRCAFVSSQDPLQRHQAGQQTRCERKWRTNGRWESSRRISKPSGYIVLIWLVVSTPLKNISQLGWLFPIYGNIKNVPNHQPVMFFQKFTSWSPISTLMLPSCSQDLLFIMPKSFNLWPATVPHQLPRRLADWIPTSASSKMLVDRKVDPFDAWSFTGKSCSTHKARPPLP